MASQSASPTAAESLEDASDANAAQLATSPAWTYSGLQAGGSKDSSNPVAKPPRRQTTSPVKGRPNSESVTSADRELQTELSHLRGLLKDRDAKIEQLTETINALRADLDHAVTQNELLLAARSSESANVRLNELSAAIRRASADNAAAVNVESAKDVPAEPARAIPNLERTGRSLAHATKGRVSPRSRPKSKAELDTNTIATSPDEKSGRPPSQVQAESLLNIGKSAVEEPEVDEEEQKSRKIFAMGGVSILGGNQAAMMSQLKAGGTLSRSQSTEQVTDGAGDAAGATLAEPEIKAWIYKTLEQPLPETGLQALLKDGQVLCKYGERDHCFLGMTLKSSL
ncbi:hypothetical protein HDU87_008304 [Geranomyces variabilis]|uniref:Uncharacterized protein n=1 Tax=Geranomyces variabilis TaxID=109894 RepID=A0AAD5XMR9_9FUNG|nr:hypothetical protein HDU87_008304 [Geranomyces variabilis]